MLFIFSDLTPAYILSQVFAFAWFVFLILTYFTKSITKIRIYNVILSLCLIISFFLLNALTGVWATLLYLVYSLILCHPYFNKTQKFTKVHISLLMTTYIVVIIITYFTYQGWHSLLPCITSFIGPYSIIQKKPFVYKILQIPQAVLFLIYHFVIYSYVGFIAEIILLTMLLIGMYNERRFRNV